jgi:hypothetical protein
LYVIIVVGGQLNSSPIQLPSFLLSKMLSYEQVGVEGLGAAESEVFCVASFAK